MKRFAASPDHIGFFRSLMNLIDVIAIVPYFITLSTMFADRPISNEGDEDDTVSHIANNQVSDELATFHMRKKFSHTL